MLVTVRQIGRKRPVIGEREIELPVSISALRGLIEAIVGIEVAAYNAGAVDSTKGRPLTLLSALSQDETARGAESGKISFGQRYNLREQKLDAALENAVRSFEDGLYRVFVGDDEMTELDAPLSLAEGDKLTFIRLALLAGRLWSFGVF